SRGKELLNGISPIAQSHKGGTAMRKQHQQAPTNDRKSIPHSYSNLQDGVAVQKLKTALPSSLPVDRFANLLCKRDESPNDGHITELRWGLIAVYIRAAAIRLKAKAT